MSYWFPRGGILYRWQRRTDRKCELWAAARGRVISWALELRKQGPIAELADRALSVLQTSVRGGTRVGAYPAPGSFFFFLTCARRKRVELGFFAAAASAEPP